MPKYNENISFVDPTQFVNDENINKPLTELKENVEYVINYLNGNKTLLAGVYGNLWDFDEKGNRAIKNAGKFDSYKKCHVWTAREDFVVVNNSQIFFDELHNRCVYDGKSNLLNNRDHFLEREIFVPDQLRGQKMLFAIKCAPSNSKTDWDSNNKDSNDEYLKEVIGIQIMGIEEEVKELRVVGNWEQHEYFSNKEKHGSSMSTAYVSFKTKRENEKIKIRVYRTAESDNYLHVENVFLGGLCLPYEGYNLKNIDINEYYDFYNNSTKINSSTIMGHKVADELKNIVGNDVVTYKNLNNWFRDLIIESTIIHPSVDLTQEIFLTGSLELNTGEKVYTLKHVKLREGRGIPTVTLTAPNHLSPHYSVNLFDIKDDEFSFVLSGMPVESGYKINWNLGELFLIDRLLDKLDFIDVEDLTLPDIDEFNDIFREE